MNLNKILLKKYKQGKLDYIILIDKGANCKTNNSYTIHKVTRNGHLEFAKFLIENRVDYNA